MRFLFCLVDYNLNSTGSVGINEQKTELNKGAETYDPKPKYRALRR